MCIVICCQKYAGQEVESGQWNGWKSEERKEKGQEKGQVSIFSSQYPTNYFLNRKTSSKRALEDVEAAAADLPAHLQRWVNKVLFFLFLLIKNVIIQDWTCTRREWGQCGTTSPLSIGQNSCIASSPHPTFHSPTPFRPTKGASSDSDDRTGICIGMDIAVSACYFCILEI